MPHNFEFRVEKINESKNRYFAKLANSTEPEFFLGQTTYYKNRVGITNWMMPSNTIYNAKDYADEFSFWAYFIEPTANVESNRYFNCINTYDRAFFTFGFLQFAAHVPNGDFVNHFKKLLQLPDAKDYFPLLYLENNRIFHKSKDGNTITQLESKISSDGLMKYLNPTTDEIEHQELLCVARFMHWVNNNTENKKIQVKDSINQFKKDLLRHSDRLDLNGYPAKVCVVICDILHHGRGNYALIETEIKNSSNIEQTYLRLLEVGVSIGKTGYSARVTELKNEIAKYLANGIFNKVYNDVLNVFE